jgi:effector-binding domain-containing protein
VCKPEEMMEEYPKAVQELMATLKAQGISILGSGGTFAHHTFKDDMSTFDFHVGFCVDRVVEESGRVKSSSLPSYPRAVYTEHLGGYESIRDSWSALMTHVETNGFKVLSSGLEVYEIGYHSNVSEEKFVTKLYRAIE